MTRRRMIRASCRGSRLVSTQTRPAARLTLTVLRDEVPGSKCRTPNPSADRKLDGFRRTLRPQSFKIVEFADLGPEDVEDHVPGIDQHPIAIGQALDVGIFDS